MFWQPLFWVLLVPTLIVMGVVYGTSKQLYRLFQILSTFTYVILVAYVIDVFSLGRNWILGLLVLSAALMLLLAYRLTRKPEKKRKPTTRNLVIFGAVVVVMLLLILLGSLRIGTTRTVAAAETLSRDALWINDTGFPPQPSVVVANITYANSFFLPYVIPDQYYAGCLHDASTDLLQETSVMVDGQYYYPGNAFTEVSPGESVTKRIGVSQDLKPMLAERIAVPVTAPATSNPFTRYDALTVISSDTQVSCSELEDLRKQGRLSLDITIALTE